MDLHSIEKLARQRKGGEKTSGSDDQAPPQTRKCEEDVTRPSRLHAREAERKMGYRFEGEGTILTLWSGTVPS